MTDVRLIDANALKILPDRFKNYYHIVGARGDGKPFQTMTLGMLAKVQEAIDNAPTIDAVHVVRCSECKHWSGRKDKPGEVTAIGYCDHPNHHIMPLRADWFCADGAKMDAKEAEHGQES